MIRKDILGRKGKLILKTTTVFLTAIAVVSMAELSACAATTWSFWGDQEEFLDETSDNVCVTTLYKGQTEQFLDMGEVTGEITWSVENPEIVDISEDGELIPLKVGNTLITVIVEPDSENIEETEEIEESETIPEEIEESEAIPEEIEESDEDLGIVTNEGVMTDWINDSELEDSELDTEETVYQYYVSVCKKKAYKAVKKARNAIGSSYSQARRMQKGYYDCSSLVWRSYSPYGIMFGEDSWAPTAAEEGRWCDENGKAIKASKDISDGKLLPGDLIFYSKQYDNGRYKKISHVAIFEGYQVDYDEETGESTLSGTIIEASGDSVVRNTYRSEFGSSGKEIAILARPTK